MKEGYQFTKQIPFDDDGVISGVFGPEANDPPVSAHGATIITLPNNSTVDLGHFDTADEAKHAVEEYLSQHVFDADVSEICDREILKINCLELDPERYRRLEDHIRQNSDKVVNAPFEPKVFELTDREVDKGKAVERVMCIVGAEREEVAVFGDGDNDIFMLGRFRCGWQFPEQMPRQILEWRRDGDQAGDCIMH